MSRYQDSDSSDDDVCFGKYTLKEFKKDVQKYVPQKINRRHTLFCAIGEPQKNTRKEIPLLTNHSEGKNDMSDSNSKWSSEYITASENMSIASTSQNSEFLEKLTKVINEPVSEASSYNTAFDRTNILENENIQCDDTFLKRFNNQTTIIGLDNIHQTLVENTVLPTSYSLDESCNYDFEHNESSNNINDSIIISISDESSSQLEYSARDFVTYEGLNVTQSPVLSNGGNESEEYLEESTNEEEFVSNCIISTKSQLIDGVNYLYEGSSHQQSENHGLYSYNDEISNVSDSGTELKEDYSYNFILNSSSESDRQDSPKNTSLDSNLPQAKPLQRFERVITDCNQLSKISEKTEFTTCIGENSSLRQQEEKTRAYSSESLSNFENDTKSEIKQEPKIDVHESNFSSSSEISKMSSISGVSDLSKNSEFDEHLKVGICSKASAISPVQIPEICLEQFDDSHQFDDTLEDMNRFLEQGVSYNSAEATSSYISPLKKPFGSNDIISASFMNTSYNSAKLENKATVTRTLSSKSIEKCKKFYSAEKIAKPLVQVRHHSKTTVKPGYKLESSKLPSASARNLFTKSAEKLGEFKVPTNPIKKLVTPSKLPKPTLRNVVSPVGVYIKHSPKYCPMIRVPEYTGDSNKKIPKLVKPNSALSKENIPGRTNQEQVPKVIYRPAKNREITEEKDVVLPESIRKLIKEQVITKHEQRIQGDDCNQSIERRLMDSDVSINLNRSGSMGSNQDISILTTKQPFNIKRF